MDELKVGNKMVEAHQYLGCCTSEKENHCDFANLWETLICTNMKIPGEQTHTRRYQFYRFCKLEERDFSDVSSENKPLSVQETYEAKRHIF